MFKEYNSDIWQISGNWELVWMSKGKTGVASADQCKIHDIAVLVVQYLAHSAKPILQHRIQVRHLGCKRMHQSFPRENLERPGLVFPHSIWQYHSLHMTCSGQKKPDSWGHHSEALSNLGSGNWRGKGLGKGLRKGRSVYKQPETKVDGSCHS